jgi:ketopantoate reductase
MVAMPSVRILVRYSPVLIETRLTPGKVVRTPSEAKGPFDYIVCAHKAVGHGSVPEQLAPAITAKLTTLVIIQNGVGNEEPFRNAFPECSIITCVVGPSCMHLPLLPLLTL